MLLGYLFIRFYQILNDYISNREFEDCQVWKVLLLIQGQYGLSQVTGEIVQLQRQHRFDKYSDLFLLFEFEVCLSSVIVELEQCVLILFSLQYCSKSIPKYSFNINFSMSIIILYFCFCVNACVKFPMQLILFFKFFA